MALQYAIGGAIIPFITLWLRERGLSMLEISRVLLCGSVILLLSPFFWGLLADRYIPLNRLFGVMNLLAAMALTILWLPVGLVGLMISFTWFYGCYQPAPSLVNALAFHHLPDPWNQFSALRAWGSVGWMLPSLPIFLWMILAPNHGFSFVVPLTIGLSLSMAVFSFALPHTPPGARTSRSASVPRLGYGQALKRLFHNSNFLVVLASYFLVSSSFCILSFYSPPQLVDLGLDRSWIGPVQSIGVAMEILLFYYHKAVLGRIRYANTVLVGCAVLVIRQLLFAFCDNLTWLILSYFLVGTTVVFYHIGIAILVDNLAGPEVRSTAQTLLLLCSSGLGPVFGNWAVAQLVPPDSSDLTGVFLFSAGLALLAFLLIWWRRQDLGGQNTNRLRTADS